MNIFLCQFIYNYRLLFGEIYENYLLFIFIKCFYLSSFNFVVIFYDYIKGRFLNLRDRFVIDKRDIGNRNEDMFLWCYIFILFYVGDL